MLRDTLTCLRTQSKSVQNWDFNSCPCEPQSSFRELYSAQVAQGKGCPEEGEAASAWRMVLGMTFLKK